MISVFDLFSIGLGPSSSHTVGPMRAAVDFAGRLADSGLLSQVTAVRVDLYGSLAATGPGHGTLTASAVGLEGLRPEQATPEDVEAALLRMRQSGRLRLGGPPGVEVGFDIDRDVVLHPLTRLARHPNALRLTASTDRAAGPAGAAPGARVPVAQETYYSVGGGFIVRDGDAEDGSGEPGSSAGERNQPTSGAELLRACRAAGGPISDVVLANECRLRSREEVLAGLAAIHAVMRQCFERSVAREGTLPGPLNVRRRAGTWHRQLLDEDPGRSPALAMEWVNLVAMAVNEENASGGRVVTAPTNGAAGIIPAVLHYALTYIPGIASATDEEREDAAARFLLTAGAIGVLYKTRASISGAEVGCQGEVGSAASMAAAGLAELLGGTPEQVENAAEIAMEHHLGMTCDPIGGLVQIPCIERNAIAAHKAINAARMALRGDGVHHVSLDQVIETMRQTGADMSDKYKETAAGGLAVNVPLC